MKVGEGSNVKRLIAGKIEPRQEKEGRPQSGGEAAKVSLDRSAQQNSEAARAVSQVVKTVVAEGPKENVQLENEVRKAGDLSLADVENFTRALADEISRKPEEAIRAQVTKQATDKVQDLLS